MKFEVLINFSPGIGLQVLQIPHTQPKWAHATPMTLLHYLSLSRTLVGTQFQN